MSNTKTALTKTENASVNNLFRNSRPQAIIIQDTYNNPFFPIPNPRIDSSKPWLPKIINQFQLFYSKFKLFNLPWHFVFEIVEGQYTVYNTRPINRVFPLSNTEALLNIKTSKYKMIGDTEDILKHSSIDIRQCIHCCVIGDSTTDVYTMDLYRLIGERAISPFFKLNKQSGVLHKTILNFNLGSKFKFNLLTNFIKK